MWRGYQETPLEEITGDSEEQEGERKEGDRRGPGEVGEQGQEGGERGEDGVERKREERKADFRWIIPECAYGTRLIRKFGGREPGGSGLGSTIAIYLISMVKVSQL